MTEGLQEFKKFLRERLSENRKLDRLDYIEIYAEALKNDNGIFKQQKMLIDSQMQSSRSFFKSYFKGQNFKEAARKYLKAVGKI